MKDNITQLQLLELKFQFAKSKEESDKTLAEIVKMLPNDYDLGEYIRKLYSTKIS